MYSLNKINKIKDKVKAKANFNNNMIVINSRDRLFKQEK